MVQLSGRRLVPGSVGARPCVERRFLDELVRLLPPEAKSCEYLYRSDDLGFEPPTDPVYLSVPRDLGLVLL